MFRKVVVSFILTSMMLHCAGRMNFLSYLFEQRHSIAYQIGLIAEIPIAICSSDYDFNKGLKIEMHDDDGNSSLPSAFSQAREIALFFLSPMVISDPRADGLLINHLTMVHSKKYTPPGLSIFHPPA